MNRTPGFLFSCAAGLALFLLAAGPAAAQLGNQQGLIDPNVAAEKDLLALPHMNGALVKSIMEKRPFASMTEVNAILAAALSNDQRKELYGKMFVHLNLNQATAEEILLIPGLGRRMVHEFEEYRPYKSLAQFRREMAKYVNAQEVARMEQYVFVPINLNTATDEQIMTIPGLGQRMLHEFKEYRPYKSMEQFRREMAKYVNAKEVARLERYVTIE
jgi:DNA uptake protein ComE-like DNA-binding protein